MLLVCVTNTSGQVIATRYFHADTPVTIGSAPDNDIHVEGDRFLSRAHGRLEWSRRRGSDGQRWDVLRYVDLKSTNGSVVARGSRTYRLGGASRRRSALLVEMRRDGPGWLLWAGGGSEKKYTHHELDPARPMHLARIHAGGLIVHVDLAPRSRRDAGDGAIRAVTSSKEVEQVFDHSNGRDRAAQLLYRLLDEIGTCEDVDGIVERASRLLFEALPGARDVYVMELGPGHDIQVTHAVAKVGHPEGKAELRPDYIERVRDEEDSITFAAGARSEQAEDTELLEISGEIMCVPLTGRDGVRGALQVQGREPDDEFASEDLKLVAMFARVLAPFLERNELVRDIRRMFRGYVLATVKAIEARDPYTAGHSERVARYSVLLGRAVNETGDGPYADVTLSEEELVELEYAALLHDLGKVAIPERLLLKGSKLYDERIEVVRARIDLARACAALDGRDDGAGTDAIHEQLDELEKTFDRAVKPGPLTDEVEKALQRMVDWTYEIPGTRRQGRLLEVEELDELLEARGTLGQKDFQLIRRHPVLSWKFLNLIPWPANLTQVVEAARDHHEKLDGSGYPDGKLAGQIGLATRIITIADIFDALTASDRPYRKARTPPQALEILSEEADRGELDRDLLDVFVAHGVYEEGGEDAAAGNTARYRAAQ